MNQKFSLIGLILLSVIFTSCEGPEGPQGPAGPKGDTGAQGATGATGSTNIIYSDWLALPTKYTGRDVYSKYYDLPAAPITKEVIDKAAILVYCKQTPTSIAQVVPATYIWYSTTNDITKVVGSIVSKIFFREGTLRYVELWTSSATIASNWYNRENAEYELIRYVIIPGGTKARVKGLDYSNYEAVKAYYGLDD